MSTGALSEVKRSLLEARLRGAVAPVAGGIPADDGDPAHPPMSYAQERLWFLEQLQPGTGAYLIPMAFRIRGSFDRARLEHALTVVVATHAALRTVFSADATATPQPTVLTTATVPLRVRERTDVATARQWLAGHLAQPFDLATAPLLRAAVIRLGPDDHVLGLVVHHIACDGWSVEIVVRDLWRAYQGQAVPAPPLRAGDVAGWQRRRVESAIGRAGLEYWRELLAGVAPLALPGDRPRPAELEYAGGEHSFVLDAALTRGIEALARRLHATPYMVLLAAYQVLVGRWARQDDFAVGTPVAGRAHPDAEPVVGMFVNTVALRADLSGEPTFGALVDRVSAATLAALRHEDVPFERIVADLDVARDLSRSPVFQTSFVLQNYQRAVVTPAELAVDWFPLGAAATHGDLELYLDRTADTYACRVHYRTALFDAPTIGALGERYRRLLAAVVGDPDLPVSRIPLMDPAERARELAWGNDRDVVLPELATLVDMIARQVVAVPDAPAVTCAGRTLSYAALDRAAGRIASRLAAAGAGPGTRVGVLLAPSVDLVAGMLGAMRAGAACVPLDPEQPADRLALMIADSGIAALVTDGPPPHGYAGPVIAPDCDTVVGPGSDGENRNEPPQITVDPGDLAYVIYTSGSTGRPKGVAVAHRQAVTYVVGVTRELGIEPGGRYLLTQSLSFDFGLTLFYAALTSGGCLHLVPPRISGADLAAYLREHDIDYLKLTPSHFEALAAGSDPDALIPRRMLLFGGEASAAPRTRALAALAARRGAAVVNHYGPTEATVGVATYRVDPDTDPGSATTPIGRPLPGARIYLLDDHLEPVPAGTAGELYLGGDRLARGYLGQPALTADRFVPDPFGPPGARLYRSGDLGRRLPDGSIEFLGRRDLQVKIRGYRVEPGEIEAALLALPGVRQAVVDVRGTPAEPVLVGYLVSAGGPQPDESALRAALAGTLPPYMIPGRFLWLPEIALARHGKVDRRALPEPPERDSVVGYAPPDGPVEEAIASVWAELLGVARVGADDDFFALGGHSLLAVRAVPRLARVLPTGARSVSIMDIFRAPTVRELARYVQRPDIADEQHPLLHRLTPARPVARHLVCAPYGGGSALIYKPLADALPPDWALHSIAVPGHEVGEAARPVPEVAAECAREILADLPGPVVLYGHCGLGVMLTVEIARRLAEAGHPVEAIYLGGNFPTARLGNGPWARRWRSLWERLRSDRWTANILAAAGLEVDGMDPAQRRMIIENQRRGTREAERYFGELFAAGPTAIDAPVISVVGERDPSTEFATERYREWHALSDTAALVTLDEAGHFFVRWRATELAAIVTGTHTALAPPAPERPAGSTYRLAGVSRAADRPPRSRRDAPSVPKFAAVSAGQLVSLLGSALTEFALPLWVYLNTGSLARFVLFTMVALVPGVVIAPLAGTLVDRFSRRRVMLAGDCAAGTAQAILAVLYLTGRLHPWHIYALLTVVSLALTFQRLAFNSAVAQLVPKRYLGHATGIVQMINGIAQFFVPLAALGILALIGIGGILSVDVASYLFAVAVTACVRFPDALAARRRESVLTELREGVRFSAGHRGLRAMLLFFAAANVFLAPLLMLINPLVLSMAPLHTAAVVATVTGAGVAVGGLAMAVWGGPRRRRMRSVLLVTLLYALCGAVAGAVAAPWVVALGGFGMGVTLALVNGIYVTIVLVKVPQRFHGRVFALNQMVAWSMIPLACGLLAPAVTGALHTVSPGRAIGLTVEVFAAALVLTVVLAARTRALARFDETVPDAAVDDLVGVRALGDRLEPSTRTLEVVA